MIQRSDLFHLSFYKKEPFTGSFRGMRYRISKDTASDEENAKNVLRAYVYPEPYSFSHTPDEDKISQDFPFTEEGLDKICDWLNENYTKKEDYWLLCLKGARPS